MKNLERARPVDEAATRFSDEIRANREGIAIAGICVVQAKDRLQAAREGEQLPDGDARFAGIVSPCGDSVGYALIEVKHAIFGGGECRQTPKRFRPAVD